MSASRHKGPREILHSPATTGVPYMLQLAELGPREKEQYGKDAIALVPQFRPAPGSAFSWCDATPPRIPIDNRYGQGRGSEESVRESLAGSDTDFIPTSCNSALTMPGLSPDMTASDNPSPDIGGPETPHAVGAVSSPNQFRPAPTNLANAIGLSIPNLAPTQALAPASSSSSLSPSSSSSSSSSSSASASVAEQFRLASQLFASEEPVLLSSRVRPKSKVPRFNTASATQPPPGIPADWGADAPSRQGRDSEDPNGKFPASDLPGSNNNGSSGSDRRDGNGDNDSNRSSGGRDLLPGIDLPTHTSSPQFSSNAPVINNRFSSLSEVNFERFIGVGLSASAGGRRTRSSRLRVPRVVSQPAGTTLSLAALRRGGAGVAVSPPALRPLRLADDRSAPDRLSSNHTVTGATTAEGPGIAAGSRSSEVTATPTLGTGSTGSFGSNSRGHGLNLQFGVSPVTPSGARAQLQAQAEAMARASAGVPPMPWETAEGRAEEARLRAQTPWTALQTDARGRSASEKVLWVRGDDLDVNPVRAGPAPWVSFPHTPLLINGQLCDAWGRAECSVRRGIALLFACCIFPPAWLLMGAGAFDNMFGVIPQYVKATALVLGGTTLAAMILCATLISLL